MISPHTETPAPDKRSVPDGSVVSLKLSPFTLTAGSGAVAPMRLQTEWTDLLEIVPESSAARLCDFSLHVMILVMPSSSSLSRYSTTAGNSGFAESLSLVSPAPCRVNFVDEFHLGASDCLLHPVLADLHGLQDRLRRWRERRRVAQLNCPLLVLVAGSGLSARGTGNCWLRYHARR